MAITIESNPITTAIESGIGSIPGYLEAGQRNKTAEINNQINQAGAMMQMLDWERQNKEYNKLHSTGAIGYDNPDIQEYFSGLKLLPGAFQADITNSSGWTWTGNRTLPNKTEAWNDYQALLGGHINPQDETLFEKYWGEVEASRHKGFTSELNRLNNLGYDTRDIRWIMANNPVFDNSVQNLHAGLAAEVQDQYAAFLPGYGQRNMSLSERWSQNAPYIAGGALGAGMLSQHLSATPQKIIDEANLKYDTAKVDHDTKVETSKDKLKKAEKIKAKSEQAKKAKKTRIKNAKKEVRSTKNLRTRELKRIKLDNKQKILDNKNFRRYGLTGTMPKTAMGIAAPYLLRKFGGMVAGDPGEAVGQGAGGLVETGLGVSSATSLSKKIMEMYAKNTLKRGAAGATMSAADLWLPFGEIAATGLLLYGGISDTMEAYKMWKEHKARKKR